MVEIILLLISRMPVFDAITLSFGTAGTGGFGIKGDSIASYTALQQWIITIFMILFGVNFNAYYLILFRKFKKALQMEEVKAYFGIIFVSTAIITGSLVMGNLMLEAEEQGIGSCWIHRAKEEFESEEGKEILKSLGIEGDYEGIGHCILGYADGPAPKAAPRKDSYVYHID